MNFFDNEKEIISSLQSEAKYEKVCFFPETKELQEVFQTIVIEDVWNTDWVNSSGKDDPPPDFYSDKYKLMMDVMRIDDHTRPTGKKNRFENPVNIKESKIQRELHDILGDSVKIIVNPVADLPSREDHNYGFYKDNYVRILKKHIDSLPLYCKNHPDHKTIFFVFDESSAYLMVESEEFANQQIVENKKIEGNPEIHFYFIDREMLLPLKDSGVDYLIIYAPYKKYWLEKQPKDFNYPRIVVLDLSLYDWDMTKEYDCARMISSEA